MDLIKIKIPVTYITEKADISWQDIKFGLDNELVDPVSVIDLIDKHADQINNSRDKLVDYLNINNIESIKEIVDKMANRRLELSDNEIRDKWLYITLAWIYDHRNEYSDPLQIVEEIYADFGYPDQIKKFVRYMPMEGPDLGDKEKNENRLFRRWEQYIENSSHIFG